MSVFATNISALVDRVVVLESSSTNHQSAISTLQGRMSTAESDIDILDQTGFKWTGNLVNPSQFESTVTNLNTTVTSNTGGTTLSCPKVNGNYYNWVLKPSLDYFNWAKLSVVCSALPVGGVLVGFAKNPGSAMFYTVDSHYVGFYIEDSNWYLKSDSSADGWPSVPVPAPGPAAWHTLSVEISRAAGNVYVKLWDNTRLLQTYTNFSVPATHMPLIALFGNAAFSVASSIGLASIRLEYR